MEEGERRRKKRKADKEDSPHASCLIDKRKRGDTSTESRKQMMAPSSGVEEIGRRWLGGLESQVEWQAVGEDRKDRQTRVAIEWQPNDVGYGNTNLKFRHYTGHHK